MLNWIRKILFRPVLWASNRFSSKPDRQRIYKALSALLDCIIKEEKKKVQEVYIEVGLKPFHFSTAFKKQYGMPPTEI